MAKIIVKDTDQGFKFYQHDLVPADGQARNLFKDIGQSTQTEVIRSLPSAKTTKDVN